MPNSPSSGARPRELIAFLLDELSKQFPLAEDRPRPVSAPGTSCCFSVVLLLVALALGGLAVLAC